MISRPPAPQHFAVLVEKYDRRLGPLADGARSDPSPARHPGREDWIYSTLKKSAGQWGSRWFDATTDHLFRMDLAHTLANKVEAAYRRGDLFEKRRPLMTAWSAYCEQPPGAKLVEFPA